MTNQEIKSLARKMAKAEAEAKAAIESDQKKGKKRKLLNTVGYMAGSIALFAAACAVLPTVLTNVSGVLYKSSLKKANRDKDDDDWGPIIERKEKPSKPEHSEQATAPEEEDVNGN